MYIIHLQEADLLAIKGTCCGCLFEYTYCAYGDSLSVKGRIYIYVYIVHIYNYIDIIMY